MKKMCYISTRNKLITFCIFLCEYKENIEGMLLISCWQSGRVIIEKITGGGKKVNIYLQVSLLISTFAIIQNNT